MTNYIDYIRALKAGITINDYSHTYKLMRLASMRHVKSFLIIPVTGACYTRYHYEPPVVTVSDAPPLAVVEKPLLAHIRLPDKIRYKDGKRVISEQWSGRAYPVTGVQHGFVLLDTGHGTIGRKPANVLIPGYTQAETVKYLAIRFASVQIAEAA